MPSVVNSIYNVVCRPAYNCVVERNSSPKLLLLGLLPPTIVASIGCFMMAYNTPGCCCCDVIECRRITARYSDLYTLRRRVPIQCYSHTRIDHNTRPVLIYAHRKMTTLAKLRYIATAYAYTGCIWGLKRTSNYAYTRKSCLPSMDYI